MELGTGGSITLPVDYFRAVIGAYDDFQREIKRELKGKFSPLAVHLSDIQNYLIIVRKTEDGLKYEVQMTPKPFQEAPVKGGGAHYIIDGKTFEIVNKEYSM